MKKLPLIREIQETDLAVIHRAISTPFKQHVTRAARGAEQKYSSCSNVAVKGSYAELCTIPSLCETCFSVDEHVDGFPGNDAVFSVKNVMDCGQCNFVERALNWVI